MKRLLTGLKPVKRYLGVRGASGLRPVNSLRLPEGGAQVVSMNGLFWFQRLLRGNVLFRRCPAFSEQNMFLLHCAIHHGREVANGIAAVSHPLFVIPGPG